MTVTNVSAGNLKAEATRSGLVLVECRAPTCGACRMFGPVFEKVANKHPEHRFLRLDISAEGLAETLRIENTPTLLVYRDEVLLFRQAGNWDEPQLEDIVRQAASLDMEVVRADLAATGEAENKPGDGS